MVYIYIGFNADVIQTMSHKLTFKNLYEDCKVGVKFVNQLYVSFSKALRDSCIKLPLFTYTDIVKLV